MSPRQRSPLTMEYVLLGWLAEQPQHGYDLHKSLLCLEGVGLIWNVQQAALYAALDRLEELGLIQSRIDVDQHPTRKELSLTIAGQAAFSQWKTSPVNHPRQMRQDFLARLYFIRQDGNNAARQLVEKQLHVCDQWLGGLQQQLANLPDPLSYDRWVLKFRITNILATSSWLREIKSVLCS